MNTNKHTLKDIESTGTTTYSSNASLSTNDDDLKVQLPTIEITPTTPNTPRIERMDTVDDIDADEAFISELMAIHPNDEDIVVEDIEFTPTNLDLPPPIDDIEQDIVNNPDENEINEDDVDDGVRE